MTYPKTVFLIRHAEKPIPDDDDNPHLSAWGWVRASGLRGLFHPSGRFAVPDRLVAADHSKHSNRCVETLRPLSELTGSSINHEFEDDEYKKLAKRIVGKDAGKKYDGATILICWHHARIPNLAKALGVWAAALPCKKWPDDVFDAIWILRFDEGGLRSVESERQ